MDQVWSDVLITLVWMLSLPLAIWLTVKIDIWYLNKRSELEEHKKGGAI